MIQMFISDLLRTVTLRFYEGTEINFTGHLVSAVRSPTANKPQFGNDS